MFLLFFVLMVLWTKSQGLKMNPDRSQFYRWESVVLDCENPDWILRRTTRRDSGTRCGQSWGEPREFRCLIQYVDPMDGGWYWCESREGQSQGGRNITVTDHFRPPAETPPTHAAAETRPAVEYVPPLDTDTPPGSQRPLPVALLFHLLVLCPYVLSTVVMVSLCRHTRSGNQEQQVMMTPPPNKATGLDKQSNDITAVTIEHHF
ncbi:hypothetical protein WMY93_014782 [Mugilogobius chulae]|uniref:Ig-like domain-containing protein n=1 Tax=Mugilogobius chulae TaxID=88201 RepID=A0AAW0P692_9GOBI